MTKPTNILVLSVDNSHRSIMAEALINKLGKGHYRARSAGSNPAGSLHPKTIETLKRHNFDLKNLRSKSWNEFSLESFTAVIAVCREVENKIWPLFPGNPPRFFWNIPDPLKTSGTDAEMNAAFEKAYLLLKEKVEQLITERDDKKNGAH